MSATSFKGSAISHQDGNELDGNHLIWFPPSEAGYSIHGFDVQRREHRGEQSAPNCYLLTEADFNTLHTNLRFSFPSGRIAFRKGACPGFPEDLPDDPYRPDNKRECIDFRKERSSPPNPRKSGKFSFATYTKGEKELVLKESSDILETSGIRGLDGGHQLIITFGGEAVENVSLSLLLSAKFATIVSYDENNKVLEKQEIQYARTLQDIALSDGAISRIVVTSPNNELLLNGICYEPFAAQQDGENDQDIPLGNPSSFEWPAMQLHNTRLSPAASNGEAGCIAYTIYLDELHNFVEIAAGYCHFLAVAFSEGKAVASGYYDNPGSIQAATFRNRKADKVVLYCATYLRALSICLDSIKGPGEEEREWANEKYIAKGIQLPLVKFNPGLSNFTDEVNLAKSRLLPAESMEESSFQDWSQLMNTAADVFKAASPIQYYHRTRQNPTEPFIDLDIWPYGLSTMADYRWRRMLGFAYQDKEILPGSVHDYRITGYFRRADTEELFLGFRTVPEGIRLPLAFRLDTILLYPSSPATVAYYPEVQETASAATSRKGIRIAGDLRLRFPVPIDRLGIEFAADFPQNLTYQAFSSEFLPGSGSVDMTGAVPNEARVLLAFATPINELHLMGDAFLHGFRLQPIQPNEAALEVVKRTIILSGVALKHSPEPPAPPYLGTTQLQQPPVVGDGQEVTDNPRQDLGFQLYWLPPSTAGPTPWPDDLDAFPPFDVLAFHLERRRFDTSEPFANIDESERPPLFMGSRSSRPNHPTLSFGVDLLTAFPANRRPSPPVTQFMEVQDPLHSAETKIGVPGGLYQYRIFSIDILNRLSKTPTLGSVVRLEKHIPPPIPGGVDLVDESRLVPTGVHSYTLQKSDPDISPADLEALGTNDNAIVLEWGWSDEQRSLDPFAREFRVYLENNPPDLIYGTLVGNAVASGGLFEMQARMERPVAANQFVKTYIQAGGYPFKINAHTAGSFIDVFLEPSMLDTSITPMAGKFLVMGEIQGGDIRPANWDERTAIVPITSARNYKYILYNVLSPSATHPMQRKWVGVSAADAQSYIPDERTSGANSNRPGNESSIAVAPAAAKYFGRPVFTLPPPLANVPELPTKEPVTDTVPIILDLPALFNGSITVPADHKLLLDFMPFSKLMELVRATESDQIRVDFPDGTHEQYTLSNPTDQAALLAQIRSGEPARIEGRFVVDLFNRYAHRDTMEKRWDRAIAAPIPFASIEYTLPAEPSRYLFRVRLVDQAGHISENAALLPVIPRVRSLRASSRPVLAVNSGDNDTLEVSCSVLEHFDLQHLVLFIHTTDLTEALNSNVLEKAQFLRLPNRTDLYPSDGVRLRLQDGTILTPAATASAGSGTVEGPMRRLDATLTTGYDRKVAVWGVMLTRDGIPSPAGGPVLGYTGPQPIVVPTLSISSTGPTDQLSWGALLVPAQVSIERSFDAGSTWERISPWLQPDNLSHAVRTRNQARQYRLLLKDQRGQVAEGSPVTITI